MATTTTELDLFKCPSCNTMVKATATYDLAPSVRAYAADQEPDPIKDLKTIAFDTKLSGMTINHRCQDNRPHPQQVMRTPGTRPIADSPQA
jgi:hypothetical protein